MRSVLRVCVILGLASCTSTLDMDRARSLIAPAPQPALPALEPTPSAGLPAPEGLRASAGELRAIPLRWDPLLNGDVAGYAVERASAPEGPFQRVAALAGRSTTSWVDRGPSQWPGARRDEGAAELEDAQTLYYRVRAITPDGRLAEAASDVASATTAAAPDPPSGLRAYSHQPRQVPLSWEPSPNPQVSGYVVERSPTALGPFQELARIEGRFNTGYLDGGLGDLRVFHYRVSAVNEAGGQGQASEPVRAVTKPEPLPPIGLRVAERRLGVNELAWEPNVETDLARYELLRVGDEGKTELVESLPADVTRATDAKVRPDETLAYAVVAIDQEGLRSEASEGVTVEGVGYELRAKLDADGIQLRWNPRSDEGYVGARIFRQGALSPTELAYTRASTWRQAEAKAGQHYRFTVVLEKADGQQAPPSSPIEILVPGS